MDTATTPQADAAGEHPTRSIARHLPTAARLLLGLLFFVTGLSGFLIFLGFLPQPSTPMPERAVAFGGALMKTGYLFPLLKGTELVAGILLVSNRFVPLALALIAPIIVNIFAFHAFLAPSGVGLAVVLLVLEGYLAWAYRNAFRPMLAMRVAPASK